MSEYICKEIDTPYGGYLKPESKLIRCKDCIHHHGHDCENMNYRWTSDDFYCGWAERKEE